MFSLVFCVNNKTFAIFAPTNIFIMVISEDIKKKITLCQPNQTIIAEFIS